MIENSSRGILYESICLRRAKDGKHYLADFKRGKGELITTLTPELVVLRAKAGVSQEELSDLIGVSRQTYSAIERGAKQMSWSTFLSLVLFYDCNQKTHEVLRSIKAIPQEVMSKRRHLSLISLTMLAWVSFAG